MQTLDGSELLPVSQNSQVPSLAFRPRPSGALAVSDGIGLAECWHVIRRFRRLILSLAIGSLVLTGIVVFLATPNFVATSTLLIEPEPPQVLDIRELISESGSNEDHDYYKTQYDLLQSRDLAATVIRSLNLEKSGLFDPSSNNLLRIWSRISLLYTQCFSLFSTPPITEPETHGVKASEIDAYLSRLKIEPKIGTRLVAVSFSAPDAHLAARITDTHVREYISQGLELRSESRRVAVEFLETQLVDIKKRVQKSEAALNSYRHRKGIVSFDVEDTNKIAESRMDDLTKALTEAETRRITAEAQMRQVRAGNYDSLPQVVTNPAITALKPQVRRLQAEYAHMSTAFNPEYPKLAELKAELVEAHSALDREMDEVAHAIDRNYKAAVDQEKELRAKINAEKERDLAMNDASLQDAVLAREVETNRELYKSVLLRMQQIQVGELAPVTNISIVDRANIPTSPATPKKRLDMAIGALLALLCGITLAFILDQMDNRLKTIEAVEDYLHLPTLAVAPDFTKLRSSTARNNRIGFLRGSIMGASSASKHLERNIRQPAKSEVYRSIRTALMFSRAGSPPGRILVASATEGEGKTWTALHTALAFAQTGAKTLLMDADLRRAQCHAAFEVDNSAGLSEVLVGQLEPEEAICHITDHNLFLLPSGSHVPNPAELLISKRMVEILRSLAASYQYIVIDSAPLMHASDTVGIATIVDGVVLVAGARTPKHSVRRAAERLAFAGANILGVVLNRVDIHHPDHREYTRYYFLYDKNCTTDARRAGFEHHRNGQLNGTKVKADHPTDIT
ncbi:MAG TPA: polysaccharide biosynthesis tyrosine autokinase [Candidatus Binataceae bacterium]|nr:polysaccharide biosynthesis tyrosine autokinase [Candidatus Binataceae bacterium]